MVEYGICGIFCELTGVRENTLAYTSFMGLSI
jgi:hypothetical protein